MRRLEVVDEPGDVAQRGRHQDELRLRQLEQRHLPGPAPVGVGVEVELVHHDLSRRRRPCDSERRAMLARISAVAQMIGACSLTAASPVSMPTLSAPNTSHSAKNFSLTRGLDRGGVERAVPAGQRRRVRAHRHQRLPGTGRRREDDVAAGDQLDERLLLRRVEREALLLERPVGEHLDEEVRVEDGGQPIGESHDVVDGPLSGRVRRRRPPPRVVTAGSRPLPWRCGQGRRAGCPISCRPCNPPPVPACPRPGRTGSSNSPGPATAASPTSGPAGGRGCSARATCR